MSNNYKEYASKEDLPTVMTGATADAAGTSGLVPAPDKGNQNKFLKADGTWNTPTDTIYTHPTAAGYKHIPAGGSSNKILRWASNGTAKWDSESDYGNIIGQLVLKASDSGEYAIEYCSPSSYTNVISACKDFSISLIEVIYALDAETYKSSFYKSGFLSIAGHDPSTKTIIFSGSIISSLKSDPVKMTLTYKDESVSIDTIDALYYNIDINMPTVKQSGTLGFVDMYYGASDDDNAAKLDFKNEKDAILNTKANQEYITNLYSKYGNNIYVRFYNCAASGPILLKLISVNIDSSKKVSNMYFGASFNSSIGSLSAPATTTSISDTISTEFDMIFGGSLAGYILYINKFKWETLYEGLVKMQDSINELT